MDKIIGFSLSHDGQPMPDPPWLSKFHWLSTKRLPYWNWRVTLWGHGDLCKFVTRHEDRDTIIVGYSDTDLRTLSIDPLQNRGLVVEIRPDVVRITNDALGMQPVFYAKSDAGPLVSTCEESIVRALGRVTIGPGRLASYLLYQSTVGTLTLWSEINKLYANRTLEAHRDNRFVQLAQPALQFPDVSQDPLDQMKRVTSDTIHRYTDPLNEVVLPLSSGMDSRLILCHMDRPGRIKARSYPSSWPAEKSWEIMISKASAKACGVGNYGILDFQQDYSKWTQSAIEYYGTPISAVQTYLYGASEMIGQEWLRLPVISGVIGDVLAGRGTQFIERSSSRIKDRYDLYRMGCYCHDKEWKPDDLDACLAYDWRASLEVLKPEGRLIWQNTECATPVGKANLIRIRNRCSQTITYPWAALDIWGSIVPVYCDRDYVSFMLALPPDVLRDRNGQRKLFARYFPHVWPHAGVDPKAWNATNTMNTETIRNGKSRSLWPLVANGSKPAHRLFKPVGIKALYGKALSGDETRWFKLNSMQTIAWAIDEGYVRDV